MNFAEIKKLYHFGKIIDEENDRILEQNNKVYFIIRFLFGIAILVIFVLLGFMVGYLGGR